MKKNGFTMAELMGVLVVLALLAILIAPAISKVVKGNQQKLYQIQIETIEKAAKDYATKNMELLPEEGKVTIITLEELKRAGMIAVETRNPITKELFPDDLKIEIRNSNQQYIYTVMETNLGESQ